MDAKFETCGNYYNSTSKGTRLCRKVQMQQVEMQQVQMQQVQMQQVQMQQVQMQQVQMQQVQMQHAHLLFIKCSCENVPILGGGRR